MGLLHTLRMQKPRGALPLIKMHLTRRCGHRSGKRIAPADIAGFIRGFRPSLNGEQTQYAKPVANQMVKYKPKSSGRNGAPMITETPPLPIFGVT